MSSFLIANSNVGMQRDLEPWLIPEAAYPNLFNAYVFRDRTVRKYGARRIGSLCVKVSPLPGPFANNAYGAPPVLSFTIGTFVPGSLKFTTTATGLEIFTDLGNGIFTGTLGNTGTISYSTGLVSFIGFSGPYIAYTLTVTGLCAFPTPRTPVMGIGYRTLPAINFEESIFFDQQFSYRLGLTGFSQFTLGSFTWHGSDSDFFWTVNARNPLVGNTPVAAGNINFFFATNFYNPNAGTPDPIRYLNNTDTWVDFTPFFTSTTANTGLAMFTARCIVPFKNRLLFFNTWEGNLDTTAPAFPGNLAAQQAAAQNFPNRCRFSWIGNPTQDGITVVPGSSNSGYIQSPPGKGGFVDAATGEQIISVAVLKDYILVKFETQSWRLAYTGNFFSPFEWQKINQEFGSDSTFSTILFDDYSLTIGNRAITKDTSIGVKRIDEKIPDVVFEIQNANDGTKRVQGARDFYREQVYWSLPTEDEGAANTPLRFPNRMLCYSYRTGAFSFFKDCFTALGKMQNQVSALWGHTGLIWGHTNLLWGGASENAEFEQIAAGNCQGNVFVLQDQVDNDPFYELTNVVNVPDSRVNVILLSGHNIENGDFVRFSNVQGFDSPVVGQVLGTVPIGQGAFKAPNSLVVPVVPSIPTTPASDEPLLYGSIIPGSMTITVGAVTFTDLGTGSLSSATPGAGGLINYEERSILINFPAVAVATPVVASYRFSWLNGRIFGVAQATSTSFVLQTVNISSDLLTTYFISSAFSPTAFTFGQVTYLTNFSIESKQLNPLVGQNTSLNIPYIDIYTDGTDEGKANFLVRTDDNLESMNNPINTYTKAQWTLSTDAGGRQRFWQRMYVNARGEFIQITLGMSNVQMVQEASFQPFVLHGLAIRVEKAGRLIRTRY